eukprot:3948039-Prorocentrum_lima.AAC.1
MPRWQPTLRATQSPTENQAQKPELEKDNEDHYRLTYMEVVMKKSGTKTQEPTPTDAAETEVYIETMFHRQLKKVEAQQNWIDKPHE